MPSSGRVTLEGLSTSRAVNTGSTSRLHLQQNSSNPQDPISIFMAHDKPSSAGQGLTASDGTARTPRHWLARRSLTASTAGGPRHAVAPGCGRVTRGPTATRELNAAAQMPGTGRAWGEYVHDGEEEAAEQ